MKKGTVSSAEHDRIADEINMELEKIIRGCETLDMQSAFEAFDESPEFLMMGTDGTVVGHDEYLRNNVDYLSSCKVFSLSTKNKEIRILDRDTAILAWSYSVEAKLKTGERDVIEGAGASFVFRKKEDKWKVVYYHESTAPPKRI